MRKSRELFYIQNQNEMQINLVEEVEKIINLEDWKKKKTTKLYIYIRIYIGNNNWPYKYLLYLHGTTIHKYLKRKSKV